MLRGCCLFLFFFFFLSGTWGVIFCLPAHSRTEIKMNSSWAYSQAVFTPSQKVYEAGPDREQSGWPGPALDSAQWEYFSQLYLKASRERGCIAATAHFWLTPTNQAYLFVSQIQAFPSFLCVVKDVSWWKDKMCWAQANGSSNLLVSSVPTWSWTQVPSSSYNGPTWLYWPGRSNRIQLIM